MNRIALIAFAALAASSTIAAAHSNDARQAEQYDLIEQGRRDGSITWSEGIKLRAEQRDIARVEDTMRADGRFTRDEKRALHNLQNGSQTSIAREANDGWHRPWWLPRFGF